MEPAHCNPELLVAHADFVRTLCGKLVFDEDTARDVAQETWLSALKHPPRADRPVRAWLSKVARNHVLQLRRASQRRIARELTQARDAGVPSTADIVERESARRSVVAAVVALSEPYRSTILLRYYEDLPPREVARRLGVPVETVRTRLKRGHALLRARLDDDYGDDREAWCKALLPFVLARPARVPWATLAVRLGLAFGGAAILAFAYWFARAPATGVSAAGGGNVSNASIAQRANSVGEFAGERREVELAPRASTALRAASHGCTAHGRVVDERGLSIAGARVLAFGSASPSLRDGALADVLTDTSGQFEFTLPSSVFYLHASADERAAVAGFSSSLEGLDQLDDIVLQLVPALTVRGRVVDESGAAIARVPVRATTLDRRGPGRSAGREGTSYRSLLELSTSSALDGTFELRGLPAVKNFVTAALPGFEPAGAECSASTDQLVLVLERAHQEVGGARDGDLAAPSRADAARTAVVTGRVLDASTRAPIPRFTVTVRSPAATGGEQHRAFDSPDGAFEYSGLAAATSFVAVHCDGYAPWSSRPRDLSLGATALEVELAPQRSLDLRVVDARGEPVQHARLVFSSERGRALPTSIGDGYWNDTVIPAPDGTAHIAGLPAALVQIEVRVPELAVEPFTFDLGAPVAGERELRVPCDLSSPRRTLVLRLPSAASAHEGEFHIEARDARGVLTASCVLGLRGDEIGLVRPLRYLVQRFDETGVLLSSSLQTLESDSLVRDHGPQLVKTPDSLSVSLRVPLGELSIRAWVDDARAPASAVPAGARDSSSVLVLERWN